MDVSLSLDKSQRFQTNSEEVFHKIMTYDIRIYQTNTAKVIGRLIDEMRSSFGSVEVSTCHHLRRVDQSDPFVSMGCLVDFEWFFVSDRGITLTFPFENSGKEACSALRKMFPATCYRNLFY